LWTGIVQGVSIFVVAQFLRLPPRDAVKAPAAQRTSVADRIGKHQFTTAEILRAPQFYVLYLIFVLIRSAFARPAQASANRQGLGLTAPR